MTRFGTELTAVFFLGYAGLQGVIHVTYLTFHCVGMLVFPERSLLLDVLQ